MPEILTGAAQVDVADGSRMAIHWAGIADGVKRPGVIVFQEAFGVNHHIRDLTARLAREGYFAAAPELFHRTGPGFETGYTDFSVVVPHMKAVNAATLEADALATYGWMQTQGGCDGGRVGAIGFCLGGRATFVANSVIPLRAGASFYGGGIAPDLLPLAAKQHGPILLVWGGADQHILPAQRRAVADALSAAKKSFTQLEFADADHGFFCDERKQYHPESATQAWAITREFLKCRLG